jgi:hypothetical protein
VSKAATSQIFGDPAQLFERNAPAGADGCFACCLSSQAEDDQYPPTRISLSSHGDVTEFTLTRFIAGISCPLSPGTDVSGRHLNPEVNPNEGPMGSSSFGNANPAYAGSAMPQNSNQDFDRAGICRVGVGGRLS